MLLRAERLGMAASGARKHDGGRVNGLMPAHGEPVAGEGFISVDIAGHESGAAPRHSMFAAKVFAEVTHVYCVVYLGAGSLG